MVAIGFLFFGVMIWAGVLWKRKRLYDSRLFLKTLIAIQPLGFIAVWLGWITAEMGRQPWIVYGLMRTSEGVSPIAGGNVVWSLAMFAIFFGVIGTAYFYYTLRTLQQGPDYDSPIPHVQFGGTATAEKLAERRD
jgi:cytochrome bd ubiquinol oxidase subunit I